MTEVAVRAVAEFRDRSDFVALPYRLHAGDPCWGPPLRRDVRAALDPRRSPFFEHGAAECFLARRAGRVVGRIAAAENRTHNEVHRHGNFQEIADQFRAEGAFVQVASPDALADALLGLLTDEARRRQVGERARALLSRSKGAVGRTVEALSELVR